MFVYESYLLLNLRQMIYEFSLKYFKSYFVTVLIKLRSEIYLGWFRLVL